MSAANPDHFWRVADLIPHRHSMQLLDQILAADKQSLWASASATEKLSSCWGIEYMGQATAAFFTLIQLSILMAEQNEAQPVATAPAPGMLIGSRRYQAHQPLIEANSQLLIKVSLRSPLQGSSPLVKFQGSVWKLESNGLSQLPLSTAPSRLPYDTATLAALKGQLLVEGDLSVYIPSQQLIANPS